MVHEEEAANCTERNLSTVLESSMDWLLPPCLLLATPLNALIQLAPTAACLMVSFPQLLACSLPGPFTVPSSQASSLKPCIALPSALKD